MINSSILAASIVSGIFGQGGWTTFAPGQSPLENPLKGYATYLDDRKAVSGYASMAYIDASWAEIEPEPGKYRFDKIESRFNQPLTKGKSVVFRVWLDYPAQKTGVPKWLIDKGVKMTPYTEFGGGVSPDYENSELKTHLVELIDALGKRFGNLKTVRFVELGFLGHWGEWHTYPHDELFASPSTQSLVVDELHKAFPNTMLMARNATYKSCDRPWMGFHDDMIPDDTDSGEDWNFLPQLIANHMDDNWKVAPAGGEMVPFNAKRLLSKDWDKLTSAVKKCHFSFLAGYSPVLEMDVDAAYKARSEELVRLLGYTYRLDKASLPADAKTDGDWRFEIDGSNIGVAPFYYRWPVHLALLKADGSVAQAITLQADIRKWLPGEFVLSGVVKWQAPAGDYRLAIGVLDPATEKPSIAFANRLEIVDGWTILEPNVRLHG